MIGQALKRQHGITTTLSRSLTSLSHYNITPQYSYYQQIHPTTTFHKSLFATQAQEEPRQSPQSQQPTKRPTLAQRPRSLASLNLDKSNDTSTITNDNKIRSQATFNSSRIDSEKNKIDSMSQFRENIDIRILQYCRDPRSHQFRAVLDYFDIPYHCIEISPFLKSEFEVLGIEKTEHHGPYVTIFNKKLFNEEFDVFKQRSLKLVTETYNKSNNNNNSNDSNDSNNSESNQSIIDAKSLKSVQQLGNPTAFKDRIHYIIDNNPANLNDADKSELKRKFDELYDFHDQKIVSKMLNMHHSQLLSDFLPWVKKTVANREEDAFFAVDDNDLEYCTDELVDLIRINQANSFSRAFQLFEYVKTFKKSRNWGTMRVESIHARGGLWTRLVLKRRLIKKLKESQSPYLPLSGGLKGMIIRFLDSMGRERDGTGSLVLKPFHGGNKPDVMDVLVCGALRSCVELDMFKDVRKIPRLEKWFQQMNDEISHTACIKHE